MGIEETELSEEALKEILRKFDRDGGGVFEKDEMMILVRKIGDQYSEETKSALKK